MPVLGHFGDNAESAGRQPGHDDRQAGVADVHAYVRQLRFRYDSPQLHGGCDTDMRWLAQGGHPSVPGGCGRLFAFPADRDSYDIRLFDCTGAAGVLGRVGQGDLRRGVRAVGFQQHADGAVYENRAADRDVRLSDLPDNELAGAVHPAAAYGSGNRLGNRSARHNTAFDAAHVETRHEKIHQCEWVKPSG